jgi:hypothetical protein
MFKNFKDDIYATPLFRHMISLSWWGRRYLAARAGYLGLPRFWLWLPVTSCYLEPSLPAATLALLCITFINKLTGEDKYINSRMPYEQYIVDEFLVFTLPR